MGEAADWVLAWFARRGTVPGASPDEQLRVDYFEAELVDSFGVTEMVAEIEEHFGIRFDETHFQDQRFGTIGGLVRIIEEIRLQPS
jgi:acyl carrier protein